MKSIRRPVVNTPGGEGVTILQDSCISIPLHVIALPLILVTPLIAVSVGATHTLFVELFDMYSSMGRHCTPVQRDCSC